MILSDWLKRNELTRRDFAKRIGVSPIMITEYCNGTAWPKRETMIAIARETNGEVTANDFMPKPEEEAVR